MSKSPGVKHKADSVDIYVGENIQARRKELGLSQELLAKEVGVTFQQIQKYEKGTNRISASRMYAVAKVLKVDANYFYSGIEDMTDGKPLEHEALDPDAAKMLSLYRKIQDKKLKKSLLNILKAYSTSN